MKKAYFIFKELFLVSAPLSPATSIVPAIVQKEVIPETAPATDLEGITGETARQVETDRTIGWLIALVIVVLGIAIAGAIVGFVAIRKRK